jgi:predicted metal-dependent phosphoesterase TrpH
MVDLHLHTNASDGRCSPAELVARASAAGITVLSVVDHDTFDAQPDVARHAATAGLRAVTGIEITAVWNGIDVHVLGYFLDPPSADLRRFLERQREDRVRRVQAMLDRLRALGVPVPFEDVVVPVGSRPPHAIGRPQVARAMVRAGHVANIHEAFDRYLAEGQPAFVPRSGSAPADVVRLIVASGGIASLAHPGLLGRDELIPALATAGMQAIEVYHPDHSPEVVACYSAIAQRCGLAVTGGSDYHGEQTHGAPLLGRVTLPSKDFERLDTLARRQSSHGSAS